MRLGVDAVRDEEVDQLIAVCRVLRLDHVEVEDVTVPGTGVRQVDVRRACQSRCIACRPVDALIVPGVDVLQLGAEHAGVQIVETAVEPEAVDVPLVRAVIAQLPDRRVDVGVVREQRAAVAERAEVLLDDEARRTSRRSARRS